MYPHERMASRSPRPERPYADATTRGSRSAGPTRRPGCWSCPGPASSLVDGRIPWVSPQEAPEGLRVLLGEHDDRAWFAVVTGPEVAQAAKDEWFPLRGAAPLRAPTRPSPGAPLVFHASAWPSGFRDAPLPALRRPPRAPRGRTRAGVHRLRPHQFPRTDPAVIMVVTVGEPGSEDERCLLGRQAIWPEGRYSTLAGFCEPGETLEDAVRREVLEETGVVVGDVEYFGNQPWPLPASLMLGFVGRAVSEEIDVDDDEIEDARWFTRAEMKAAGRGGPLVLPGGVSISRSLVEHWYGGPLPGQW